MSQTYKVHLLAFTDGQVREVEVPDDRSESDALDLAYHYGQNDICPQPLPSVSVGDVIELPDGTLHMVMPTGFQKLDSPERLEKLKALPRDVRAFFGYNYAHDETEK